MLKEIVDVISTQFYANPAAKEEILKTAKERGVPKELLEFYELCNGCYIGNGKEVDAPNGKTYQIHLPELQELVTVKEYGYISEDSTFYEESASWWQIVDNHGANWLAYDATALGRGRILDIPHEEVGYEECHAIIATSLIDLLEKLVKFGGQDWFSIEEWNEIGRV